MSWHYINWYYIMKTTITVQLCETINNRWHGIRIIFKFLKICIYNRIKYQQYEYRLRRWWRSDEPTSSRAPWISAVRSASNRYRVIFTIYNQSFSTGVRGRKFLRSRKSETKSIAIIVLCTEHRVFTLETRSAGDVRHEITWRHSFLKRGDIPGRRDGEN